MTYIGVVDGVKHRGIDGKPASILVTKDDNGNALAPQRWDFDRCLGHAGQTYPKDGVMFPDGERRDRFFGVLRPHLATKHCLTLESQDDDRAGTINSIVDSVCDDVPEQYRTWLQDSSPNEKFQYLTYANGNNRVYISDTAHAELVLTDKADFHGKQEMQIVLIHSH